MNLFQRIVGGAQEEDYKTLVKEGAVIIDVRSKAEFVGGHVKGAVNIPLDTLPSSLTKLGGTKSVIITCCASGGRSGMAKSFLEKEGYAHVHNGGGWLALQKKLQ